jgi:hypothetical protein
MFKYSDISYNKVNIIYILMLQYKRINYYMFFKS